MNKNVGKTDMIVRLVLAALAVILYFVLNNKVLGIVLIILALILVVTALTKTCPIWYLFRTDTLDKEKTE
jgi:energy-coupling factor transporter transmembrane protein EcfT